MKWNLIFAKIASEKKSPIFVLDSRPKLLFVNLVKEKSSMLFVKKINTSKSIPCDQNFQYNWFAWLKKPSVNHMAEKCIRDI